MFLQCYNYLVQLESLNMNPTFLNRNVNEGFSGGEKKRNEILQLSVLEVCSPHRLLSSSSVLCIQSQNLNCTVLLGD